MTETGNGAAPPGLALLDQLERIAPAEIDDVDDFDGVNDLPPLDADGLPRPQYATYRVQVSVAYASAAQVAALGLDNPQDAKLINVTVTPPGGTPLDFPVLRGNF